MKPTFLPIGRAATLVYIKTDRFKSELLTASFAVPLQGATAQQNAMLPALSCRGTVSFPTQSKISRHLDLMYSTSISTKNRSMGDVQLISYRADFLGARYTGGGSGLLPEVVKVLSELVLAPRKTNGGEYLPAYVESEKKNLLDAIRAEKNDPRAYSLTSCRKLLCEGEPYALSLLGSESEANDLTPTTLTARHTAFLSECTPVFCYVGNTPLAEVAALLKERFSELGKGQSFQTTVKAHEGEVRRGTKKMPILQGRLSLGFRTDIDILHPLSAALLVLDEVYGGSPASKLFLNVRERRSLCYHCSSRVDRHKGVLFAASGIKPENRTVTEEAMLAEMISIKRGEISKAEMKAAKAALDHAYRQSFDSPATLARFYMNRALLGIEETVNEWQSRVARVTSEEVVEAAGRLPLGAVFFLDGNKTEGGEAE